MTFFLKKTDSGRSILLSFLKKILYPLKVSIQSDKPLLYHLLERITSVRGCCTDLRWSPVQSLNCDTFPGYERALFKALKGIALLRSNISLKYTPKIG